MTRNAPGDFRPLFSEINPPFASSAETSNIIGIRVRMFDGIDGAIRKQTVEAGMERYPHFRVEFRKGDGRWGAMMISKYALDFKPKENATIMQWLLGAPRLIQPIPVRGKLFLFDVDDAQIRYIEGGTLDPIRHGKRPMNSGYGKKPVYIPQH